MFLSPPRRFIVIAVIPSSLIPPFASQAYLPHGQNASAARAMQEHPLADRERGSKERHLCYMVFDVLWVKGWAARPDLNGDITGLPLHVRKQILKQLLPLGEEASAAGRAAGGADSSKEHLRSQPRAKPTFIEPLPAERLFAGNISSRLAQLYEDAMDR